MRIVVLAGGIGGARFLLGVRAWAGRQRREVTAVVNVGDDVTLHGLRICPDLDSVMYTLGGGSDPERGWGRAGETWTVKEELAAYGAEPTWFGLGDQDIATHLVRTRMLDAGYPLSAVTEALCARWQPGITTAAGQRRPGRDPRRGRATATAERAMHFQEWWVRHRGELPAQRFVFVGAETAKPAAGVLDALARGRRGPARAEQPGREHRADPGRDRPARGARGRPAPVVGVSPIIGGAPVRGMADRCLAALGRGVQRGRGGRALRRPELPAACSTAGWSTPADAATTVAGVDGPRDSTVDDRRDGHGGHGRARPSRWRG